MQPAGRGKTEENWGLIRGSFVYLKYFQLTFLPKGSKQVICLTVQVRRPAENTSEESTLSSHFYCTCVREAMEKKGVKESMLPATFKMVWTGVILLMPTSMGMERGGYQEELVWHNNQSTGLDLRDAGSAPPPALTCNLAGDLNTSCRLGLAYPTGLLQG